MLNSIVFGWFWEEIKRKFWMWVLCLGVVEEDSCLGVRGRYGGKEVWIRVLGVVMVLSVDWFSILSENNFIECVN